MSTDSTHPKDRLLKSVLLACSGLRVSFDAVALAGHLVAECAQEPEPDGWTAHVSVDAMAVRLGIRTQRVLAAVTELTSIVAYIPGAPGAEARTARFVFHTPPPTEAASPS